MKPHQVELEISYNDTWGGATAETAEDTGTGSREASYTVARGDSLWSIAKRFYGTGAKCHIIYAANADAIEAAAKAHGKESSYRGSSAGWWIWPGEILVIPGIHGVQGGPAIGRTGAASRELGAKIAGQATAFSYMDVASGESDSVSVTMQDIMKEWIGNLMPRRGARLGVKIILTNWGSGEGTEAFECGTFVLDDISFSGRPLSCVLKGVSVPVMDDFKSLPVTYTWEKTTLAEIASQIAARAGVPLYYDADTIQIAEVEQSRQTDSAFLYSLCERYGLAMKVYSRKIVIFDIVKYEAKKEVFTIRESDTKSWSSNITVDGTYTGVNLDYTDPDTEETIKVAMGSPGRMYAINTQASGRYDAELQAAAKVNAANRGLQTMEVVIRADPRIVASHCVGMSGFGQLDGKYYIDKITHSIGKGYTMNVSLHKVQAAIRVTAAPAARDGGRIYTSVPGDTLWSIAKRFYGTGAKCHIIYAANADAIEAAAKAHGKESSDNGHWIWPGETFMIPEG